MFHEVVIQANISFSLASSWSEPQWGNVSSSGDSSQYTHTGEPLFPTLALGQGCLTTSVSRWVNFATQVINQNLILIQIWFTFVDLNWMSVWLSGWKRPDLRTPWSKWLWENQPALCCRREKAAQQWSCAGSTWLLQLWEFWLNHLQSGKSASNSCLGLRAYLLEVFQAV